MRRTLVRSGPQFLDSILPESQTLAQPIEMRSKELGSGWFWPS